MGEIHLSNWRIYRIIDVLLLLLMHFVLACLLGNWFVFLGICLCYPFQWIIHLCLFYYFPLQLRWTKFDHVLSWRSYILCFWQSMCSHYLDPLVISKFTLLYWNLMTELWHLIFPMVGIYHMAIRLSFASDYYLWSLHLLPWVDKHNNS